MLLTPAQIKPKSFKSRRNSLFTGVDAPHFYVRAWAGLLLQSYQYPNLSEGADRVGAQLRGDKEYPFSGVTKSGRVWRKVPESDARSVPRGTANPTTQAQTEPQGPAPLSGCALGSVYSAWGCTRSCTLCLG